MNKANAITQAVTDTFESVYGYKPTKVVGLDGKKPSEDNQFLFNPVISGYEGKCKGKSGIHYLFFLYVEEKKWRYSFTPFNEKDALA